PHVSQLSLMQAGLFVKNDSIKVPTFKGGKVILENPSQVFREKDESLIHWVFEFSKGTKVKINSTTIVFPSSNRLIATWDEFNSRLFIDPAFSEGTKRIINNVDKVMISGYQLLRHNYADGTTYRDHVDNSVKLISSWKKLNPKLKIHFEQAFLRDPEIIRYVFDEVLPYVDGFGMNEDELCLILESYGFNDLAKEIKKSRFAVSCLYDGMEKLFNLIEVSRIDLHTRDFAISFLKPNYGITPKTEQNALLFGALCAATRALTGEFGNLDAITNALASPRLHLSELGLKEHKRLSRKIKTLGLSTEREFLRSGIASADNYWIVYIVTKITDNPVSTVGLGDCITAGLIVGEIE
ncbi:MAG: ADP-dependent glucokinase/phosphofructokinase, partial [Candidatus Bathyarchaeia archaeon]